MTESDVTFDRERILELKEIAKQRDLTDEELEEIKEQWDAFKEIAFGMISAMEDFISQHPAITVNSEDTND